MYTRAAIISYLIYFVSSALSAQELAHLTIEGVNSSYDEHSPMLSPNGQTLYFTRAGHPSNIGGVLDQGDIWYSNKTDQGWSQPVHAGGNLNHVGLNGVVGFSADGQRMYLLNYFDEQGTGISKIQNGISMSSRSNGQWGTPRKLPIQFFLNESAHISATISNDEQVIIMAIQSFETEGNEDLYFSVKSADGKWSQPANMGSTLNTYAQEWTPFLAHDMKSLYFTSNGHNGARGRDIFVSERKNMVSWVDWSTPKNLGSELNSVGTEQGLSFVSGDQVAYFSSTQNSEGFGDIFAYAMPESIPEAEEVLPDLVDAAVEDQSKEQVIMAFQVLDSRTEASLDADVVLIYNGQEKTIKASDILSIAKQFELTLDEGTDLKVSIQLEGYLKYEKLFKAGQPSANAQGGVERLLLTRQDVGTTVKIENILFNRARASFSNPEEATRQIDELIQLMKNNPGMAIRLEGHTDNRGDEKLLQRLSEERVKTVREYMLSKGIDDNRIEYVGYGGTKPLSDNESPEGVDINRRVEFVIIR